MAGRIRTIKPEWLDDERLAAASSDARLLSVALLLLADDHGRGRAGVQYLGAQVFAYHQDHHGKAREALRELVAMRFANVYEVEGQSYFEVRNWTKHQRVDHPGKPRVPAPLDTIPETLARIPETLAPDLRPPTSDHDHVPPTRARVEKTTEAKKPPDRFGARFKADLQELARIEAVHPRPGPVGSCAEEFFEAAATHFGGDEKALADACVEHLTSWKGAALRSASDHTRIQALGTYLRHRGWTEKRPQTGAPREPARRRLDAHLQAVKP